MSVDSFHYRRTQGALELYTDESLTCTDCSNQFTFSAGEQEFFAAKGFQNKPNRCPECRVARRSQRSGSPGFSKPAGAGAGAREMVAVTCSDCGQQTEVPFQPRGDKPVYCRECFQRSRSSYR